MSPWGWSLQNGSFSYLQCYLKSPMSPLPFDGSSWMPYNVKTCQIKKKATQNLHNPCLWDIPHDSHGSFWSYRLLFCSELHDRGKLYGLIVDRVMHSLTCYEQALLQLYWEPQPHKPWFILGLSASTTPSTTMVCSTIGHGWFYRLLSWSLIISEYPFALHALPPWSYPPIKEKNKL